MNCDTWREEKSSKQDIWVDGIKNWSNFGQANKWRLHANSATHQRSLDFLFARDKHHILNDLDKQGNGQLEERQIQNRYFFAKGVLTNVLFLAKRGLSFYGNSFVEGLLGELLKQIGKEHDPLL